MVAYNSHGHEHATRVGCVLSVHTYGWLARWDDALFFDRHQPCDAIICVKVHYSSQMWFEHWFDAYAFFSVVFCCVSICCRMCVSSLVSHCSTIAIESTRIEWKVPIPNTMQCKFALAEQLCTWCIYLQRYFIHNIRFAVEWVGFIGVHKSNICTAFCIRFGAILVSICSSWSSFTFSVVHERCAHRNRKCSYAPHNISINILIQFHARCNFIFSKCACRFDFYIFFFFGFLLCVCVFCLAIITHLHAAENHAQNTKKKYGAC